MALLDNLIEVFNSYNFFVPASVCVVVGAVLLLTVLKWMSKSDKRHKDSSVDVDDWDNETQNSLKKTKQKKVKASTSVQADSGSISSRLKVTGKQSAGTKVTAPPAKQKEVNGKPKSSAKKQVAASALSVKSTQPTSEAQGEWMVAGSKKKQKNKKTVANAKESKTQDQTDRQTKDAEEMETRRSGATIAPKDVEPSHGAKVDSRERKIEFEANESVYTASTKAPSQAEVVMSQPSKSSFYDLPASNGIEEPMALKSAAGARADEGDMESDPAGKEMKSKKSSKKKKSKVVSEPTQGADLAVQKSAVTSSQQEDRGQTMENIPSSCPGKPESAQHMEIVHKSDVGPAKVTSKDIVAENAKIVVLDASKDEVKAASKGAVKVASKDVVKVASKGAIKVAPKDEVKVASKGAIKVAPKDEVKVASKVVVPDASTEIIPNTTKGLAIDASRGVVIDDSKETTPATSKDGPASSLVAFDELGLQESSTVSGQPALKKKKKARKDN